MVGFSKSLKALSAADQWVNSGRKSSKKKINQTGAGKISKKRHSTLQIAKPKKSSKKSKK